MKTAWHIDDDHEMITAISLMMKLLDFETRPFLNAPEAAKRLQDGDRPDLLLLDINMPQVSGRDMLEFVRRKQAYKDLPVVMLSSESTDTLVDDTLAMGADAYVMKPVTLEELERAIQTALSKRETSF
jgi:CheY-like chemotaxis protein